MIATLTQCRFSRGFTLVELIITICIIGILSSFAIPLTVNYMSQARRAEAKIVLMNLASEMERYALAHAHYPEIQSLETFEALLQPANEYYIFKVEATAEAYTLTAELIEESLQDKEACRTLSINYLGERVPKECW